LAVGAREAGGLSVGARPEDFQSAVAVITAAIEGDDTILRLATDDLAAAEPRVIIEALSGLARFFVQLLAQREELTEAEVLARFGTWLAVQIESQRGGNPNGSA
jgi:hypothetical protein